MKRVAVMVCSVALAMTGCGGPSGSGDTDDGVEIPSSQPQLTESDDDLGSTETEADPSTNDSVSGLGEATVTLDGETLYFGATDFPALRCDPDTFGVFWVLLGQVDEQGNQIDDGGQFQLVLVREGGVAEDSGQLTEALVKLPALDQTWIADPEEISLSALEPGTSQVDEFTIDGNHVTGRATLFDRETWFPYSAGNADDFLVATATFEATCAG